MKFFQGVHLPFRLNWLLVSRDSILILLVDKSDSKCENKETEGLLNILLAIIRPLQFF